MKAYNTLDLLRRTFKTNNVQVKKQLYVYLTSAVTVIINIYIIVHNFGDHRLSKIFKS